MLHLPVSLILAVIVAFAGIVPPLYQSRPGRYCLHLFLHYLVVGLLVFTLTLPALPWWTQGAVIAIVMLLPLLPLPAGRGSYKWHQALLAAAVVGTALSLIKHFISDIARLFTRANGPGEKIHCLPLTPFPIPGHLSAPTKKRRSRRRKPPGSLAFRKNNVSLPPISACGEIGRRARLRIWCRETCRFESYQAHHFISSGYSDGVSFLFIPRMRENRTFFSRPVLGRFKVFD